MSPCRTAVGRMPWLWQKSWGLETLPDEKTTHGGLFVADAPLETLCLIYETPEGETVYRYLDADGDTRHALKDFMMELTQQLPT